MLKEQKLNEWFNRLTKTHYINLIEEKKCVNLNWFL
jgi:hypothetical protein